ncbi:ATP-binding protein [Massilia sp. W12]|uniref:sensor histidine kinase n=1 Tax=Massilia sp. W12 TaxID=3126507 RepID=UPI0030CB7D93
MQLRLRQQGTELLAEVEDNGCGMDETVRARILEPFFTTKQVGKGSGLGLSIAFGIIEKHGGRLNVRSSPGAGSCFQLYLPLPQSAASL